MSTRWICMCGTKVSVTNGSESDPKGSVAVPSHTTPDGYWCRWSLCAFSADAIAKLTAS